MSLQTRCWSVLLLLAVSGCVRPDRSILEREVASGRSVGSVVAGSDTTILLVYQPSEAFACYGWLQSWIEWGRHHPGRVVLILTRAPTHSERVQMAKYRIRADGVLRPILLDRVAPPRTPMEVMLLDGRVVASESVRPGVLTTPLFRRATAEATTGSTQHSSP